MRRPNLVLSSSLAAIGLSASIALAQQSPRAPSSNPDPPTSASSVDPSMAARPTRYLLRNGQDYLAYQEYARALSFFKAVEARKGELNETELQTLKKGIAQAQQGLREAVNSPRVVAQGTKGRTVTQPGGFALANAKPAKAPTDEATKLTSGELPAPPPIRRGPALPAPIPQAVVLPEPEPVTLAAVAQVPAPAQASASTPAPASAGSVELPPLPDSSPVVAGLPPLPGEGPKVDSAAVPTQLPAPVELPPTTPSPLPGEPPSTVVVEPSSPTPTAPVELPPTIPVSTPAPTQVELPPMPTPTQVELPPAGPTSPPLPMPVESPAPASAPELPSLPTAVEPTPRAMVAEAGQRPDPVATPQPSSLPEPPPAAEAPPAPEGEGRTMPSMPVYPAPPAVLPNGPVPEVLSEKLRREVEMIAQRPGDSRTPGMPATVDPNDPNSVAPSTGSPRLAIERAPSPTEARPLRRIPVPEEFVNLGKREWDPNRKYWAAAGTCHMILYFQDPVLERYGQSVEQSLGPWGRYFSYPLDDPKQSNQRNQILQPFYSMGKFCFQVGTLPYKLVVDPPWEAEYDLGYYRPGDRIPADTIMITPFGVGPPGKGRNY